jgi:phenylalanyl-tRNA synthetase alpha chain
MLHQVEAKIMSSLLGRMSAEELSSKAGVPLSSVLSFSQSLKEKGMVSIESEDAVRLVISPEAKRFSSEGLPEQKVLAAARSGAPVSSLSPEEKSVGIAWATRNGWVRVDAGSLCLAAAPSGPYHLQEALRLIGSGQAADAESAAILEKRRLVSKTTSRTVYLQPTLAQKPLSASDSEGALNTITRQMLLSGDYKGRAFRKYDVSAPSEVPSPAKRHLVRRLQSKISRIFSDMGFEEMDGSEISPRSGISMRFSSPRTTLHASLPTPSMRRAAPLSRATPGSFPR